MAKAKLSLRKKLCVKKSSAEVVGSSLNSTMDSHTAQSEPSLKTEPNHGVVKIVSGGQTGVDRGALDAAIALGIPHGGWCPKGRWAEDGPIHPRYQLVELPFSDYARRTEQNVIDSHGTLVLYRERLQGGTALTCRLARAHQRPLLKVRIDRPIRFQQITRWLDENRIQIVNIAGPRGSSHPSLEAQAFEIVKRIFTPPATLFTRE